MEQYTERVMNKGLENKLEIKLKGERNYLYNLWEINEITGLIANIYYKNELLNTIESLLAEGVSPKKICILNQSVKVGQKYNNIKEGNLKIDNDKGLNSFYHLGSPIPLFPEKEIFLKYYIFQIFRAFFTACNSNGLTVLDRRGDLFSLFNQRNEFSTIKKLKEYLENEVRERNLSLEIDEFEDKLSSAFDMIAEELKQFGNYLKERDLLDSFNEKFEDNISEGLETKEFRLLSKYFKMFRTTFAKHNRPIICVIDDEKESVRVLCPDLISVENATPENYRFLQTKNISQNSPLYITIVLGIGFAPAILQTVSELIKTELSKKRQVELEIEELESQEELDGEIRDRTKEKNKLDEKMKEIEDELKELQHLKENKHLKEGEELISHSRNAITINSYVIENIRDLSYRNIDKFEELLDDKDLVIEDVD